jgi:hypothetical protein
MDRKLLILFTLLAACRSSHDDDLQYVKQVRSIAAEWALVNEQASAGQVTSIYVRSMHRWLHDGLETASRSLSQPRSRYGAELQALLAEPPDAAPGRLRRHADQLKQLETELESA